MAGHRAAGPGDRPRDPGGGRRGRHLAQPVARAATGGPARRRDGERRLLDHLPDGRRLLGAALLRPVGWRGAAADGVGGGTAEPDQPGGRVQPAGERDGRPLPRDGGLLLDAADPRGLGARRVRRGRPARDPADRQVRGRERQRVPRSGRAGRARAGRSGSRTHRATAAWW